MGEATYQLVQDFFHQQYQLWKHQNIKICLKPFETNKKATNFAQAKSTQEQTARYLRTNAVVAKLGGWLVDDLFLLMTDPWDDCIFTH